MKQDRIQIPRWFDRHLHLRDGDMMANVLPSTLAQRARGALVMPNLAEPIITAERALAYRERILACRGAESDFAPILACYLTDRTTPDEVVEGYRQNAWGAVKLYMADQNGQGGTTGSAHGVRDLASRYPVFEAMERHGIPLLGHFEAVERDVDEFDREAVSVERDMAPIRSRFPGLPIVAEHVTDGRMADYVAAAGDRTYATVTAHHLRLNRNDLFWGGLAPDHWCKPVAKREEHRLRVRDYVTSGHPRFGAGTDSAPHDVAKKALPCGCAAGIFTAPCALELYAQTFDEDGALEHLGAFLSSNFVDVYGLAPSDETLTLERAPLEIPKAVGSVRVFRGGETLPWKLVG